MKRTLILALSLGLFACGSDNGGSDETPVETGLVIPDSGFTSPASYPNMTLVWEDDFSGSSLNTSNWSYETGTGNNGWGNFELQYYTEDNTSFVEGNLIIEAKRESVGGSDFTSSRIITSGKQDFQYGRIDIRAVLPEGQGLWPALWMLGSNFDTVGWPFCGEIDIMEMVGGSGRENSVFGTAHWDDAGTPAKFGGTTTKNSGTFNDEFHVFSILWNQNTIRWYVDGQQYHVIDITPEELSELRNEHFLIFNIAVGGTLPGSPDNTTSFPQYMIVDYVRYFQFG